MGLASAATRVTLIAVHAVVNVAADTSVIAVGLCLRVAVGALENGVVARIGVAGGAHPSGVAVVCREERVIERGACPRRSGVARVTSRWESSGLVVRIRSRVVVRLMAANAGGRQRCVVIVYVATGARHSRVKPSEREGCVVVVERGRNPRCRVVAYVAGLRESNLRMIRTRCRGEIL